MVFPSTWGFLLHALRIPSRASKKANAVVWSVSVVAEAITTSNVVLRRIVSSAVCVHVRVCTYMCMCVSVCTCVCMVERYHVRPLQAQEVQNSDQHVKRITTGAS